MSSSTSVCSSVLLPAIVIIMPAPVAASSGTDSQIETQSLFWRELLPSQKLEMHAEHTFAEQIKALGPITHIRLNVFPDGGVSRLRVLGKVAK